MLTAEMSEQRSDVMTDVSDVACCRAGMYCAFDFSSVL